MKNKIYILILFLTSLILIVSSCDENSLLEKPLGTDLNIDSVFASKERALSAVSNAYFQGLRLPQFGYNFGTTADLSGENISYKSSWENAVNISNSGMVADGGGGNSNAEDQFNSNYYSIRQSYQVLENIDKVGDMTQIEKDNIKGEMLSLIAYKYQEMFKRFGGVPLVGKSLSIVEDEVYIPRATIEETLNFIIKLCDDALALLPDRQTDANLGRATKAFPMSIKSEALMFAARPLFNTSVPYMDMGENNNLICLGKVDNNLWQRAADAAVAIIDFATSHGHSIINTGNPLDDYGMAVGTPGNKEYIMTFRNMSAQPYRFIRNYYIRDAVGYDKPMSYKQLSHYYKADGTNQSWPAVGQERPYSDYLLRIEEMEPRYKASAAGAGINAWNNPNDSWWDFPHLIESEKWVGHGQNEGSGFNVKFWYKAGRRNWFEYPIYRLAEFYLNAAEAFNEVGQPVKALQYLNVIRERAGLPQVTETNVDNLRKIIQREWAIEFYFEDHRYFDIKHWKLSDINNGNIGGARTSLYWLYISGRSYAYSQGDYRAYTVKTMLNGFWNSSQYLHPFPAREVNKRYIIQNPGY